MATLNLGASVGAGGRNDPADVRALKTHLIALGFDWLSPDDSVDGDLRHVINLQQSIRQGRDVLSGDGRVDVPGRTYDYLRSQDVAHWQMMPAGGGAHDGYVNLELQDLSDHHDFGTSWMAETLAAGGDVPLVAVKIGVRPADLPVAQRIAVARAALADTAAARADVSLRA